MKDYIALVTVGLHKFARQIAGGVRGRRRQRSLRRVEPMHYERAPHFRRVKLDVAPPPLRYAVQGFAPLRRTPCGVVV